MRTVFDYDNTAYRPDIAAPLELYSVIWISRSFRLREHPTNVPGTLRESPKHFPFIWFRSTEKAEAFPPPRLIVLDFQCGLVRGDNRGGIFSAALVNWLKFSVYRGDILKCFVFLHIGDHIGGHIGGHSPKSRLLRYSAGGHWLWTSKRPVVCHDLLSSDTVLKYWSQVVWYCLEFGKILYLCIEEKTCATRSAKFLLGGFVVLAELFFFLQEKSYSYAKAPVPLERFM